MVSVKQQSSYAKGTHGEWLAVQHLQVQGFTIIAQRYKCSAGEIDIIAFKENMVVFVEVKARATTEEGLYSITPRQIQRILGTAGIFLSEHTAQYASCDIRFDVITVANDGTLNHIPHAFDGDY